MNESEIHLSRRRFLLVAAATLGVACVPTLRSPESLDDFAKTLPRQVGETVWTGEWRIINGPTANSVVEGYFDQDRRFRHRINLVEIITHNTANRPLTLEQMKAVFRKEVNHLYSYEFIDTVIAKSLDLKRYPLEEVHVLADGLGALKLSPEDQRLLNLNYSRPIYNYDSTGRPYYPNPEAPHQSVLKEGEYTVWDERTLTYPMLAAVDIMSTRMKVISPHGLRRFGPDLLRLIQMGG